MTAREAVCLNESVPQLQVPQAGDTYLFPRDCTFTTAVLTSSVADGASAIGFTLTTAAMSTAGAKLLSVKNNTTEAFYVDRNGYIYPQAAGPYIYAPASTSLRMYASGDIVSCVGGTGSIKFGEPDENALGVTVTIGSSGGIVLGRVFGGGHGNDKKIYVASGIDDYPPGDLIIQAKNQAASNSTNLVGGAFKITAGAGASGSAGAAHGGAVYIDGGRGYGTGSHGSIYLGNSYCNGIICGTNFQQFTEMTAPAAGASNTVRLYAEDNGAGKTRLMAIFPTGAAQQVAIEP